MPATANLSPQAGSKESEDKDVKKTETALVQIMRHLLNSASKAELDQIMQELVQLRREGFELVGANNGSVELLLWCRDQSGLKRLHEWLVNFRVQNIVKSLFNKLMKAGPENKLNVVVTWSEVDYAKCEEYFNKWKKNQPVKRAHEGAASRDDGDDDPAPKQLKLTAATERPLDETDAVAEWEVVHLPVPPLDDSKLNELPRTVREMYLLRAVAQLFNIQQQTTANPDVAFLYQQLASVSYFWWFEVARKGFKRRVRELIESQCGPYLRSWTRVARLKSITDRARVRGVAYLNDLIYVVYSQQNSIGVYEGHPRFGTVGSMRIEDMRFPLDIAASQTSRCLYVLDWAGGLGDGGKIWRIQGSPWMFEATVCIRDLVSPRKLSLSADNNLLIVSGNHLVTYRLARNYDAPDAVPEIISEIRLPEDTEPQHAVATRFGTYLIGHGQSTDVPHRIIELSRDGRSIIRSYGGPVSGNDVGMLSWPAHVCLGDGDGRVILADCDNDRVLMLTSGLKLERVVLDRETHDIEKPRRLSYVSQFGWLLVGADFGIVDVYQIRR